MTEHPGLRIGVVASALVVVCAIGSSVPAAPVAAMPGLGQAEATPTPVPDLPSLSAEPVAMALALDAALNAGDVGAVLDLFDDAAQVKIPPDLYIGSAQIRNWASYLAANHYASEPGLRHLSRDSVTWPAEVRSDQLVRFGLDSLNGEATLTVRGGKIGAYTFVLESRPASFERRRSRRQMSCRTRSWSERTLPTSMVPMTCSATRTERW